ncbi:MAG: acylphosphatase, partial [Clostridium sp.]
MGKIIRVTGKVQGVGFRPFIYRLAILGRLKGFVRNESGGVYIEVEGNSFDTYEFINSIKAYAPALSDIKSVSVSDKEDIGYRDFRVESSLIGYGIVPLVSDIATCKDCVEDILSGIREGYAFT